MKRFEFNVPNGIVVISVENNSIDTCLCKRNGVVIDMITKWYKTNEQAIKAFKRLVRSIKEENITDKSTTI